MPISTTTDRSRLIAKLGQKSATDSIAKRAADEKAPLSFSQERLWIMSQLEPDNPIYNVAGAVRFDGALSGELLAQALNEVIRRHEILRSRFLALAGQPCQQVEAEAQLPLENWDLSALAENEKMPAFEARAQDFVRHPFRLDRQPPLRGVLVDLGGECHILLLTLHHMVSDRWSVAVLMQEVTALYQAFAEGLPSPLSELPIQYADYCVWQRGRGAQRQSQLEYWTAKLNGVPPLLELPLDRPRPPQPSYRGEVYSFELGDELSRQVKQLAGQYKATLFMVMAAAFSVLLYRYSGSRDFCIGYPVAGRNRSQVAGLIGFFVNTLVLRCRIDGEISFVDWLTRLREQALQDQNHQELAFGQLLDALNSPRNPSHAPLFQVMLAVQNVPVAEFQMVDLKVSPLTINNDAAQFDLTLFVDEQDGCLACSFEYAKDLFVVETIEQMAGHLRNLLERATTEPKQSLQQLMTLPAEQYRRIVEEFNATERDYQSRPHLVHALFEAQAAKTPNAVALRFETGCLSYAALNAKANRLAHELIERGAGPEVLVGVCLARSLEMVVALLAILKAGSAYVPLDPDYPAERLLFMLADCEPRLLVSQQSLCRHWPKQGLTGVRTLLLDDADTEAAITLRSDANPNAAAMGLAEANLAYVIYTSGSTGQPKGAMNQHDAVVNRLLWAQEQYRLTAGDKVMQKTPFSFDVSVWEFFLPLLAGAELVLVRPKGHQDPEYLQDLIEAACVTTLHFVPSMLQAFLPGLDAEKCRSLRQVLCSGEALPAALVARFHKALPDVALHNLYGPTEAAVDVTAWHCQPDDSASPPPIGRPIANTRLYILDAALQPVPLGVIGEIYIGGIAVGRGYCRKPALSAERFLPDPFAEGARLYKTGDLGQWRTDGGIDYLGRNDFQVKLRGFRIELGEIESRLAACGGVGEAVVVARSDRLGDKRLVAYLTSRSGSELSLGELRQQLAANLPDYMLPAAFVVLPSLPLNANGKLDRSLLPVPDTDISLGREYQAPQGEAETALAEIWQDLLELERVGRNDHFFELGGHSLLALTLAERLRREGWVLEARVVFANPTLCSLAALICDNRRNVQALQIPPNLIPDHFGQSLNNPVIEEFRI